MKVIYLLVSAVILMSSVVWAVPIDKGDLVVVEELYARAGISMDNVKIIENTSYFKLELYPSPEVTAYNAKNRKLRGIQVFINENGRVVSLTIRQDDENKKLRDLTGIDKLENLEYLDLFDNAISNLEPLTSLKKLKGIDLAGNSITNVKPLAGLVDLLYLDLDYQLISDVAALSGLSRLEMFECEGCKLKSLSGIEGMKSLKHLTLYATESNSIEELRGLSGLIRIRMRIGNVEDFTPLANKLKLTHLRTGGGAGSNSDFMSTLINLEELNMVENNFDYIPDLSPLKKLKILSLSGTKLKRIENLNSLSDLEILRLKRNFLLTKIEGLNGLTSLKELDLKDSAIKKMENLDLPFLEKLDLSGTDITKLENMKGVPNLEYLKIYDTNIEKLEGYLDTPMLFKIQANYTTKFSRDNASSIEFLKRREREYYNLD